jgi:RNA 2',3'-cyclic 3'-phosphodiesterase
MRCFVALDMPDAVKSALTELCQDLKQRFGKQANLRWVRPDGIHLTLKFLGEVADERIPQIQSALTSTFAQVTTFELKIEGLGSFPKPNAPRVLWVGLAGNLAGLNYAQRLTETTLVGLGFPPENFNFNPHLTLARIPDIGADEKAKIGRTLQSYKGNTAFGSFKFNAAVLMQSTLRPDGAIYSPVYHFPFKLPPGET